VGESVVVLRSQWNGLGSLFTDLTSVVPLPKSVYTTDLGHSSHRYGLS
jgi:hypothetical protein